MLNPTHHPLNQQPLYFVLDGSDLALQLRSLVGGDRGGDDATADTASTAERDLGRDEDVGDVLVLAKERQVQEDLERLGVGSHDDELGDTTVKGLGRLVGSLLQLAVVGRLLDDVEDLLRQRGIGERECCG
jgi:hypothetical protein